jgi:hypothetical protein
VYGSEVEYSKMGKEKRVFQINGDGELIKVYTSATECAKEFGVTKVYIINSIKRSNKVRFRYYLSYGLTNRLAKRSTDGKIPKTVANMLSMVKYRQELKNHLFEYDCVLTKKQKIKIKKEISNINYYIKNP